jgi:hypothetical protein
MNSETTLKLTWLHIVDSKDKVISALNLAPYLEDVWGVEE